MKMVRVHCCPHIDNMKPGETMWEFRDKRNAYQCVCDNCKRKIEKTFAYRSEKLRKEWHTASQKEALKYGAHNR